MPPINRRHFLQFAGSALASISLSHLDLFRQGEQYGNVLAQGTPGRKLALLVGINDYPEPVRSLAGCLTDVELQRELLVHRFGFNPSDILVVSNTSNLKPNRQTILEAFETHLIQQTKPGDVVVFHFSGHGSLVLDTDPIPGFTQDGKGVNGTIVPFDRASTQPDQVEDIMGRSLFLLMSALPTDLVTVVLDSCHSGGGTRGNLAFRATPSRLSGDQPANPSPTELEFQKQWMARLKLEPQDLAEMRRKGIAKGVAIGSAQYDQLAADVPFSGFSAGAFTYLLTRYLWQQTRTEGVGTVYVNLQRSTQDVAKNAGLTQVPIYAANPDSNGQKPIYFLTPTIPAAEAVIKSVSGGQIEFWLGGVSSRSLEATDSGSVFTLIDASGKSLGEIEQTSRRGLVGYGKVKQGQIGDIKPGMLLREQVRGVPTDLKLRLGLDGSLGQDQSSALTALRSVDRIEVVSQIQGSTVDYLLGRMNPAYLKQAQQQKIADLPPVNSVGLFTAGLSPITASFDRANEALPDAINRLRPRFKSLLAGKILQLAVGGDRSAGLKVTTTIEQKGANRSVTANTYQFPSGSEFQVKLRNNETRNLYMAALVISSSGNLTVLFPYWDAPEDAALVAPGQELVTPQTGDGYQFVLRGTGFIEVLTLASTKPLRDMLQALRPIGESRTAGSRTAVSLRDDEPLNIIGAMLGDLNRSTREAGVDLVSTRQLVKADQLAAMSTFIQVMGG
ncbi:caspase family protein [Pantanalinema sp. GBBB05]|uniref:caspase family protein n=1 Tax=Pantanalinema sp. GBBB05 TaxID=2604139 RepID=UPI001D9E7DF5|nr:DUF4384 domain-containing protein [Pantanalinema sp. GBBB05]